MCKVEKTSGRGICGFRTGKLNSSAFFAQISLSSLFVLLLSFAAGPASVQAEDSAVLEAQKVFKQYVDLERAYDPLQADLFAPNAVIKDTRLYQDGQNKVLTWNGESYKQIIKAQLPVSRARAEQFNYSQAVFSKEGGNVRMKCSRSSSTKRYAAPLEMVFSAGKNGAWKIIEESMQSQL